MESLYLENEQYVDFGLIKKKINEFKLKNNFQENIYIDILNELDKCYKYRANQFFQKWSNKDEVLKEKESFRQYLINNIFNIANLLAERKKYDLSLKKLEQLEKLLNSSDFELNNNVDKLKSYCEYEINLINGQNLLEKGQYKEAIKFFKYLAGITSLDSKHNEIYTKFLIKSKIQYIKNILEENIDLLQSNDYEEVIINSEKLLNEFQYDSKLKILIYQIKIVYAMALEKSIEEKILKKNIDIKEYEKYKSLIITENIKDNKLEEFNRKIHEVILSNSDENENSENQNKIINIQENIEFNIIPLEIINKYLNIIKNINEGILSESLEKDIIIQVENYNNEIMNEQNDINQWISDNKINFKNNDFRGNMFAIFNKINKKLTGFDIRPIQLISLLILTKNKPKLGGIFLQINTGEGKSLIIQFLAAYLAMIENKVDIITSNTVLANRDAEDEKTIEFYRNLHLTVGCASKNQYTKDIVYGDTQNFEAGILRDEFKEKNIRKNRPFNCVIVDEVDSISLDNIITMTQLTDNFPGRSSFHFFYYEILMIYCTIIDDLPKFTGKNQEYFLKKPNEFKSIINREIRNCLIGKILEEDGKTLKTDIPVVYPKCMKKYIEDSFNIWIDNVIKAPLMVENRDFIIKNKSIVPVDYSNTGVLQNNMVWDGGLQQILQIIHNAKGTFENENTNFLSNISFFRRYKGNIYGVTGTFGGENFQFILRKIYEINLYKIPPNKTSLLEDLGSIVCTDENIYKNKILENIKMVISKKRAILLICNSIAKGKEFYDILKEDYKDNVMKYFTEDDKETIENILDIGKIIVATNLAGRGTDIKISDDLERNGGLHVLVTFLPLNQRIEEQNYGRAGRKGQRGSHYLIMLYKNEYGNLKKEDLTVERIKKMREKLEFNSINSLIENEMKFILKKEEFFKDFCDYIKNSCKKCNMYEKLNIEEKWGILLKNKKIEDIEKNYLKLKNEKTNNIENSLIKVKEIVNNSDSSKKFFTKIFDLEPEYSWVAQIRYFCILAKEKASWLNKLNNKYQNQIKSIKGLQSVKTLIDTYIGVLSNLSTLDKLVFSFFIKNKEKSDDKNFKTEIEIQNENIKNFLEVLKDLIDENINTIQKYINEKNPNNSLETDKMLTIEDIIKKTNTINIEFKKDIKYYMDEFGFNTFEILVIKKNKHYIGNIVVIALGVLELCAGVALLAYSANPYIFKLSSFLIREGIKDLVRGIKASIEGEEINLKYYAIEKGVSLTCFAFEMILGKVPTKVTDTFKDKLLNVIKTESISLAKNYGNRYVANLVVKKLINKMSEKIKNYLINPIMKLMRLNGENIDKYIQYDILNDSDLYKNSILKQTETVLDNLDNLIDFLGPIIDIIKILSAKKDEKISKLKNFLEYMSNFDYNQLIEVSKNIYDTIKNTKVDIKFDNSLSYLIKTSNPSLSEEEVDNICQELIECGVINKEGKFKTEFISIKNFKQIIDIKIDDKYQQYQYNKDKKISNELENNLNLIALKVSEALFNQKKKEIKDEVYTQLETFMESLIERIINYLEDKGSEQLEKLLEKYQDKKDAKKAEEQKKEKKQENNEIEENDEIQVTKKSNQNNIGEEENIALPELNSEEIKKNKNNNQINNDIDDDICLSNKKIKNSNTNNEINGIEDIDISSKKKKKKENEKTKEKKEKKEKGKKEKGKKEKGKKEKGKKEKDKNEKKEKEKKEKEKREKEEKENKIKEAKEKCSSLRNEEGTSNFLKGFCKNAAQFGAKFVIRDAVIPRFIDKLSNFLKKMLKEKLLPLLLNRFDLYFEKLGTHLIILQKKYNIKKYIDNILKKIKKFFSIICSVQKFIIPYLKEAMKKAKTEGVNIGQIISDFIDKLLSKIDDILKPFKEFVNKVFDGKEELEAYKLYENVIKEGYQIIRKKGIIEQYEKIKKYADNKFNETKEKYLDKRKEICNLPDELEKKFEEKKNELIEKYRELKEKIINSTNDIIKELKDKNSSEELREYFKNLKKNIIDELDEIKNEAKNKVKDITSIIPNFFDNFTNLIDNIMGIKFGPFNENKIDICKHITTFILEVEQGNIKLKEENEEGEIIEKDPKELLIKYLNEKLDIKAENSMEIVEYLFKNGLKSILIEKINNTLINYANKKLENIKSYYEPSLTMIKKYFATMKGDVSTFIEKCNNKINEKIDCFDVVIKFISNIFENKSLYEFYCMIEENILIHNDLKNPLLEGINQLKDKLVGDLSNELEAQIQKLYEKIINSTKYKELKEKSKKQ